MHCGRTARKMAGSGLRSWVAVVPCFLSVVLIASWVASWREGMGCWKGWTTARGTHDIYIGAFSGSILVEYRSPLQSIGGLSSHTLSGTEFGSNFMSRWQMSDEKASGNLTYAPPGMLGLDFSVRDQSSSIPPCMVYRVWTPHWMLALPFVFISVAISGIIGKYRRRRWLRLGSCLNCGYDLRASPSGCPECGSSRRD
jgi:hypothetical protein